VLAHADNPTNCKIYNDFNDALNNCKGEPFIVTANLNDISIKIIPKYYANKVICINVEKIFDNYDYSMMVCKKNKSLLKHVSAKIRTPEFDNELFNDAFKLGRMSTWVNDIKQTDEMCKIMLDHKPALIQYVNINLVHWSKYILEKDIDNIEYVPFEKMSDEEACDIYDSTLKLDKDNKCKFLQYSLDAKTITKIRKVCDPVKYYKNMLQTKKLYKVLDIYHNDYTKIFTPEELCEIIMASLAIDKEDTYYFLADIFGNYDYLYKDFCSLIVKKIDYDDYQKWANS
jgi:hypothetical protein